ncbi:MAG: molecular chaperone [Bacteroidia bacterium]|nr:molecular chaperone [Bacteroidia bacterium]
MIRIYQLQFAYARRFIKSICRVFLITILLVGIDLNSSNAQGNLEIFPRRVVFEGSKKTETLNLANAGQDSATYNISLINYRMKDDGDVEEINTPDSDQRFANKFIRFFPRSVTLAPNEVQIIKLQLIKTNELVPGEYRSHLYLRSIIRKKSLGEKETRKDTTKISVTLTPVFGISIAVIIRVGENDATVNLSGLSFEMFNDTLPRLNMTFNRRGNMSVYGDIKVNYISESGITTEVGIAKGLAVYTPNLIRHFRLNLKKEDKVDYHHGKLHIEFDSQNNTRNPKLTEAEIDLR